MSSTRNIARTFGTGSGAVLAAVALLALLLTIPRSGAVYTAGSDNVGNALGAGELDPPTAFTATAGDSITLDWTASVDAYASGHRIYRATSPGGPYAQIAEVTPRTTVTYVDSPTPGTYYYVARAFYLDWDSVDSNEDLGMPFPCPSDADLRACIRFDEDVAGTYLDDSGNSNTVTHTNGTLVGGVSESAIQGGAPALYEIADSASLDLTSGMTLEAWVLLDSLPGTGRVGILDNDGQYGLFVYATTGLRCTNSLGATPDVVVPTGTWFHVACTWDGADLTMYIDGIPGTPSAVSGTMSTANTDPISLLDGSPDFIEPADGDLDSLRIWSVARSEAQICADAGLTGC